MPDKIRNIAIIGLGTFGQAIARELTRLGDRVLGIDRDADVVNMICDEINATVQADGADPKALAECSIETYDSVVVAIGEHLEANILTAVNCIDLGCKSVWVKAQNEPHRRILKAVGIDKILQPERQQGLHVAQIIHNPQLTGYLSLGNSFYVAQIKVQDELAGKPLSSLELEDTYELKCLGIHRGEDLLDPSIGDVELAIDDTMLIYGERPHIRKFTIEN